jgi:hypothetical protein
MPEQTTLHQAQHSQAEALRQRRRAVVAAHIAAENQHDLPAILNTFAELSYEIIALDALAQGPAAISDLLGRLFRAFPNLYTEAFETHEADEAVTVEGRS